MKYVHWTLKKPTLEIYLYLKSKNNDDPVKHVLNVKCAIYLFQPMQICQIPYVNFKTQVNSSPSFVFLFSVTKDNSSVLFQLKEYILYSKEAH